MAELRFEPIDVSALCALRQYFILGSWEPMTSVVLLFPFVAPVRHREVESQVWVTLQ